jgi:tetratricopeptide (TPR) repeat protein
VKACAFLFLGLLGRAAEEGHQAPIESSQAPSEAVLVAVHREGADLLVTLRASGVPLEKICSLLAGELGLELRGLEVARRPVLVTVDLDRRPLEQALEYVLGSIGLSYELRSGSLAILPGEEQEHDQGALLQLASTTYLRAVSHSPTHPLVPRARLDQGEIDELRGYPGAALDHYQALLEDFPRAAEVPEAYLRSGEVLQRLSRWEDAAEQFRALASLELATEHAARARLELARCTVEMGDSASAIFLLAALETNYPAHDRAERLERELVHALALVGAERYLEGLRTIEKIESSLVGEERNEGLRIRALALQGAGHPGEAARAWMLYASEVGEPARSLSLEQAARLSLEAGDEVGALFVVRQAESYGHGLRFAAYKARAYESLGFKTEPDHQALSASERIGLAEQRLETGDAAGAAEQVRHLVPGAAALTPDLRARLAVIWSAFIVSSAGVEGALDYLRDTRAALGDRHADSRAKLDVAAAMILESAGLLDRAVDAYRGEY